MTPARRLKTFTSLWAMMPHDDSGKILPYDRICAMVAEAGYDGMAIDLGPAMSRRRTRSAAHGAHGLTP